MSDSRAQETTTFPGTEELVHSFPGLRIAGLRRVGDPAGAVAPDATPRALLLCSHGWLDNAASFVPLWECLPPAYRAFAFDLSGHGRSDHRSSPFETYAPLDWVTEHALLARHVAGLAPPGTPLVLVGHSMGAGIAALTAGLLGGEVAAVVLIDGVSTLPGRAEDLPRKLRAFLKETEREHANSVFPDFEALVAARSRGGVLEASAARLLMRRGAEPAPDGGWWVRSDARLKLTTPARLTHDQIGALFAEISCPVLLLKATRSHYGAFFDEMKGLLPRISRLEQAVMEGGHHAHMEDPAPVARAIESFLARALG